MMYGRICLPEWLIRDFLIKSRVVREDTHVFYVFMFEIFIYEYLDLLRGRHIKDKAFVFKELRVGYVCTKFINNNISF